MSMSLMEQRWDRLLFVSLVGLIILFVGTYFYVPSFYDPIREDSRALVGYALMSIYAVLAIGLVVALVASVFDISWFEDN